MPYTAVIPLTFVVLVGMIKEGIEDLQRTLADQQSNNKRFTVIRGVGKWTKIRSADLRSGYILRLKEGDVLPADCVALCSSDAEGRSYIQTAQLDGETNLKARHCAKVTQPLYTPYLSQLVTESIPSLPTGSAGKSLSALWLNCVVPYC